MQCYIMDYVAYGWFTLMLRTDGDPRPQSFYIILIFNEKFDQFYTTK